MSKITIVTPTPLGELPVIDNGQAEKILWVAQAMGYAFGQNDAAGRTVLESADFALTWLRYMQATVGKSRMTMQDAWRHLVDSGELDYS